MHKNSNHSLCRNPASRAMDNPVLSLRSIMHPLESCSQLLHQNDGSKLYSCASLQEYGSLADPAFRELLLQASNFLCLQDCHQIWYNNFVQCPQITLGSNGVLNATFSDEGWIPKCVALGMLLYFYLGVSCSSHHNCIEVLPM